VIVVDFCLFCTQLYIHFANHPLDNYSVATILFDNNIVGTKAVAGGWHGQDSKQAKSRDLDSFLFFSFLHIFAVVVVAFLKILTFKK